MTTRAEKRAPKPKNILTAYTERYGALPERLISAPGRVNLIGEHTDYNDGFVLPCAINFATYIAIGRPEHRVNANEEQVEALALDYGGEVAQISLCAPIDLPRATPPVETRWFDYVQGVIEVLRARGLTLGSAQLVIAGDIPQGAGLSSSASLQVGIALAFNELFGLDLSENELALIAQRAENDYVGCQCGIMDQLASARGEASNATLIDCRDLSVKLIPVPVGLSVMIIHSGVQRGLVDSEYNTRREECEEAARVLDVKALRDANLIRLEGAREKLTDTVYRRARHVITENERTRLAARALERGDLETLGALMYASHDSLRDDYEVSVPPIDFLVDLLRAEIGSSGGARMTGGGFGGCVVALVPRKHVPELKSLIDERYPAQTGLSAQIFVCAPSDGARVLSGFIQQP